MGRAKPTPSGLPYDEAAALVGAAALRAASGTNQRSNWTTGRQLVPWKVIGPILLARVAGASTTGSARRSHNPLSAATLTAPEGAMQDATFREVWARVTLVWKHRKDRPIQWQALVQNVHAFTVGIPEEPPTEIGKTRRTKS